MNSQKSESEEIPQYEILHSNISPDHYDINNVFYHVARFLGYRIQLQENTGVKDGTDQNFVRVMVDSSDTYEKLLVAYKLTKGYKIYSILSAVSCGDPWSVLQESKGKVSYLNYEDPDKQFDPRSILERCFLRAYERMLEKSTNHDLGYATCARNELDLKYNSLTTEDIRPLDSESMGLLLMGAVKDVLKKHQQLQP